MTRTIFKATAGFTAMLVATLPVAASAQKVGNGDNLALTRLVDAFTKAQRDYDPATLAQLTTPDYVEVSPIGDVDTRDEVLGFYAPEKKRPAPVMTISEQLVRRQGDGAVMLAKLSFTAPGAGGTARNVAMRASFVARRQGRGWRLAAVQYTPMRPQGS